MTTAIENPAVRDLTPRERDVLGFMARGLSNQRIGEQLGLSTRTVNTHVKNVMFKFQAADRTHAVAVAYERGLLPSQGDALARERLESARDLLRDARGLLEVIPRCRWHRQAAVGLGQCDECARWLLARRVLRDAGELLGGRDRA